MADASGMVASYAAAGAATDVAQNLGSIGLADARVVRPTHGATTFLVQTDYSHLPARLQVLPPIPASRILIRATTGLKGKGEIFSADNAQFTSWQTSAACAIVSLLGRIWGYRIGRRRDAGALPAAVRKGKARRPQPRGPGRLAETG
jgi:hypothetical protein